MVTIGMNISTANDTYFFIFLFGIFIIVIALSCYFWCVVYQAYKDMKNSVEYIHPSVFIGEEVELVVALPPERNS